MTLKNYFEQRKTSKTFGKLIKEDSEIRDIVNDIRDDFKPIREAYKSKYDWRWKKNK